MSGPYDDLKEELKNPEFVKQYGSEAAKNKIGITLFNIRKRMNLTQKELSNKLGISQPYIAKLESGEANPTVGSVGEILAVLGFILVTDAAPIFPEVKTAPSSIFVNWDYLYPRTESLPNQAVAPIEITVQPTLILKGQEVCHAAAPCQIKGGTI